LHPSQTLPTQKSTTRSPTMGSDPPSPTQSVLLTIRACTMPIKALGSPDTDHATPVRTRLNNCLLICQRLRPQHFFQRELTVIRGVLRKISLRRKCAGLATNLNEFFLNGRICQHFTADLKQLFTHILWHPGRTIQSKPKAIFKPLDT